MIMNRNDRLKSIINDYKECLGALEQSYRLLSSDNLEIVSVSQRAFKADITDLFKILESYVTYILKKNRISVQDLTIRQAIEMVANVKGIDKEFYDKALEHKVIRDKYSYVDGKSSLRNFIDFYKEAKEPIERQVKLIEDQLEKENPSTL